MADSKVNSGGFAGHARGHLGVEEWGAIARIWAADKSYLAYLRRVHGDGEHERSCAECRRRISLVAAV